jgi:hypothetical protein
VGDLKLDERFARFEADVPGTFRPAPLDEVKAATRRRRGARRGIVACVLATLVAAPAGTYALAGGGDEAPRPSKVHVFQPEERKITVPGVDLPVRSVWFPRDAQHGWAMFEACWNDNDYRDCRYAMALTSDGGATWRGVALPDLAKENAPVNAYPVDDRTLAIHAIGKRFYLTTDGGATFKQYSNLSPPEVAQAAIADSGGYSLRCPGATGFEDGASSVECERPELVRLGSAPAPLAMSYTLPGKVQQVLRGGDGRLWLVSLDGDRTRVAYSTDDATATWTELEPVAGRDTEISAARLTASPDGQEIWLVSSEGKGLWRLEGTRFEPRTGLPDEFYAHNVVALGGGYLAVASGHDAGPGGFWHDGTFTPIGNLRTSYVEVPPDGTVVFRDADDGGWLVGTGTGADRDWVRLS